MYCGQVFGGVSGEIIPYMKWLYNLYFNSFILHANLQMSSSHFIHMCITGGRGGRGGFTPRGRGRGGGGRGFGSGRGMENF